MKLSERVKAMIRGWLNINPASTQNISINEAMSYETEVVQNRLWYRGNPYELEQFYKQIDSGVSHTSGFWASLPRTEKIRKIHSGLPALLVDTIAYVVKSDMSDVKFDDSSHQNLWADIANEIDFDHVVGKAITDTLVAGDGAFKISIDTDITQYPIVEFYSGEQVDYLMRGGKLFGVDFWTDKFDNRKKYRLRERYELKCEKCYVSYTLFCGDKEVPLNTLPELEGLLPAEIAGNYLLAVPVKFYDKPGSNVRGKSIYNSKTGVFDAHDEVISQWIDAIRAGRVKNYIPRGMIPTDPHTGSLRDVDSFGTNFIQVESPITEGAVAKIETVQPDIKYDAFLASYSATLDMCLQGILSPATLGIDVGKMSSGEAQREKKDVTGHTRNTITAVLEKVLPRLIAAIMMTYDHMQGESVGFYEPKVSFGEYGSPDFDSRIESVSKAASASIMSIESQVDELWGETKDEKWKAQEIIRIKQLKGIEIADEPSLGDELIDAEEVTKDDSAGYNGDIPANRDASDSVAKAEPEPAQSVGKK